MSWELLLRIVQWLEIGCIQMEMRRSGVHGILVLSGEATINDAELAPQNPSLIVNSVAELC